MSRFYKDFTYTWTIKNCSLFNIENTGIISSPIFTAENIDKTEWHICIFVQNDCSEKYVFLELYRRKNKPVVLDFEIELCNSENEPLHVTERMRRIRFGNKNEYVFRNELLFEELKKKLKKTSSDALILKCRMFATVESDTVGKSFNRSCTVKTTQSVDELSYVWEVTYSKSPDWLSKLAIPINEKEQLYVNIGTRQDEILFTILKDDTGTFPTIKCEITLLDHAGEEKLSSYGFFKFSEKIRSWYFPSFVRRSMLEENTSVLPLKFKFTFLSSRTSNEFVDENKILYRLSPPENLKNDPETNSLTDDLRKMLFSKEHSDVSFRIDGLVISAHKFILASRSPVFSAMFNQKMLENETGVIDISDMGAKNLQLFLEFLYTGELDGLDWERMLELLLAAEKYQVPSLKAKCSRYLKHHLSTDNVCDVVSVADIVGEKTLKETAIGFIKENVVKVFSSPKWTKFIKKDFVLSSEIFYNFSEDLKAKHEVT